MTHLKLDFVPVIGMLLTVGLSYPANAVSNQIVEVDTVFQSDTILTKARLVDDYIRLIKHPDYWNNTTVGGRSRPSNIWTRAVFYEGHMALYHVYPDTALYNYAFNWGKYHNWEMAYKKNTSYDGDNQCCGQTYLELYRIAPASEMISTIKSCLDYCISNRANKDWTWIDAIQMSMPAYALLGKISNDTTYYNYMYRSYKYTRDSLDDIGVYNPADDLWWRDKNFNSPYVNSNGKQVYWSRGNGWVYAALTRVLNTLDSTESHYREYMSDYLAMSASLVACQREDGFWNPSLADPDQYGGKETSGTSLFVYGLAWGLNQGILERDIYLTAARKGWTAISNDVIHDNGFLGWMQGTADDPSDDQPLGYDSVPNFEDFGAGCLLLAASESYKLAETLEKEDSLQSHFSYPVTKGHLSIVSTASGINIFTENATQISIHNLSGITVHQASLSPGKACTIETIAWPKGIYLVRITGEQGSEVTKFRK